MKIINSSKILSLFLLLSNSSEVTSFTINTNTNTNNHAKSSSTELQASSIPTTILKTAQKVGGPKTAAAIAATALVGTAGVKLVLDRPSRKYEDGSVAREYDSWTQDGILEYYWGEHIHLGYYTDEE